jgi:GNAT superfamily N-acetyltransferase
MIDTLDAAATEAAIPDLARILHACVHGGASVGFILPFSEADAAQWWRDAVLPCVAAGARTLLAARDGGRIIGTAQLVPAGMPNQRHRADVSKVLVHPDARRRGVARALMRRLEALALQQGRSLLVLDTVVNSPAQPLYAGLGYQLAGVIPDYARVALHPDLEPTAVMWKALTTG